MVVRNYCYYTFHVMRKIGLKSVVWKDGQHYVSQCLNVDVSSFGATKKEALDHLHEALALYFEDRKSVKISSVERPGIASFTFRHA